MRRVGVVDRTADGVAVLRTDDPPDIGTDLVDAHLNRIGEVVDVFGPTERPYLAISPSAGWAPDDLLDLTCYVRES